MGNSDSELLNVSNSFLAILNVLYPSTTKYSFY